MANYSDLPLTLQKNVVTRDIGLKEDLNSIKQSIQNILTTRRGERPYDLEFGCNISSYLFEKINSITRLRIEKEIRFALENHEPRINVVRVEVINSPDTNSVDINLEFEVINTNSLAQQTIQLRLI
jgi:phage baseplate assembly protein W